MFQATAFWRLFATIKSRVFVLLSSLIAAITLLLIAPHTRYLHPLALPLHISYFFLVYFVLFLLSFGAVAYFASSFSWHRELRTLLVIWLPAVLILPWSISTWPDIPDTFLFALGAYVMTVGLLLSHSFLRQDSVCCLPDPEALTYKNWLRAQGLPTLLLITFVTGIFFSFGWYRLAQYAAVDEPLWYHSRISKYWSALAEHNWQRTSISDKPGITLAWATGPGLWFAPADTWGSLATVDATHRKEAVENYYYAYRFPLLLTITLLLPLFYFFLERLLGKRHALFSYVLIATSPVLIGMSKIVNPDSLLWVFAPLSLLSYLVFLRRRTLRYLIFSGILLGLALLTKYVVNILFIFFLGLIFLDYLYQEKNAHTPVADYLKRSLGYFGILTLTALSIFYILFPATWVRPYKLLKATLLSQAFEKVAPIFLLLIAVILLDQWKNKARFTTWVFSYIDERVKRALAMFFGMAFFVSLVVVVVNTWSNMALYPFSELLASPKTVGERSGPLAIFFGNFYPMIFGVTPVVFLSLFLAPIFFLKKRFNESIALRTSFYLVIFMLLYYVGATVDSVATIVRYQIMLFPVAAIIAGITIEHLLIYSHKKLKVHDIPTPVIAGSLLVLLGGLSLMTTPFPLSYASSFLPAKYHIDIKDMGAGSYEVAQYLNKLPGAKKMLIWTDKDGVCKFFVGQCKRSLNYTALRQGGISYIVVSAGRESRTTKMMSSDISHNKPDLIRFDQYYHQTNPDFEIDINNRPSHYVKVFKFRP